MRKSLRRNKYPPAGCNASRHSTGPDINGNIDGDTLGETTDVGLLRRPRLHVDTSSSHSRVSNCLEGFNRNRIPGHTAWSGLAVSSPPETNNAPLRNRLLQCSGNSGKSGAEFF